MTALAGFWSFGAQDPDAGVARMLRSQSIYGGDGEASDRLDRLAMGRSLHRLLPEDAWDRGPVAIQGGRGLVVADVRIDNRDEIEAALALDTGGARRTSDAALLGLALERWGEAALDRIVGAFAFAWWDGERRRLVLARDHAGARPLYFARGPGFFAFASMPKGLHALAEVPRAPRIDALAALLVLMPETGSETMWQGVDKLVGGHLLDVTAGGETMRRWWNPVVETLRLPRDEDYVQAMREQLDRATRALLRRTAGPVASQLSGGFDSGAVTATAARLIDPERLFAFTSVPSFDFGKERRHRIGDEGPAAARVAALYPNIDHVLVRTHGRSPMENLARAQFLCDRPATNPCNQVWIDAIADEAKQRGAKMMFWGAMGNMTLSWTGQDALPRLFRAGRWIELARMWPALRRGGMRLRGFAMQCAAPMMPLWLWRLAHRFGGQELDIETYSAIRRRVFDAERLEEKAASRGLDIHYRDLSDGPALRRLMLTRFDVGSFYKGMLGGWGIDMRDPFSDRRLFEFALAVPARQYILGGEQRSLGRRVLRDRLPPDVLDEPRKGYQAADWFVGMTRARDEIRTELDRLAECGETAALIDVERLRASLDDWPTDGWETQETVSRYRLAMWRGISVGQFVRTALGSNR